MRASPSTATSGTGIYVGRRNGDELIYAGKVDHGFDKTSIADLRKRLTPLIRKTQPYTKRIAHKGIWVEPEVLAEIEYRAKSAEGKVRHPFFEGMQRTVEQAAAAFSATTPVGCARTIRINPGPVRTPAPAAALGRPDEAATRRKTETCQRCRRGFTARQEAVRSSAFDPHSTEI